ncbi:MAG TPA: S8/S53 family peptidase [Streptosporangiaceae bacterium]
MNPANSGAGDARRRLDAQLDLITSVLREKGVEARPAFSGNGNLDFLYQHGVILVRDRYLSRVRHVVGGGQPLESFVDGVTLYSLQDARFHDVHQALEAVDTGLGHGVATPNHIYSITPVWACPAHEPEVPQHAHSRPDPGVNEEGGEGVFIYVPDTGLLEDAAATHSWLEGVDGKLDRLLPPDSDGGVKIPGYAGHGTFIAGVARCMAPDAKVHVVSDFDRAGALSEHEIVKQLDRGLSMGADILCLSAGGGTRKDHPPLGFRAFWNRYRHHKGVVLVAAAGNNSSRRPFWPAAFPQVVSVGALAADGRARADFSDFGPWVDVYAPGEGLVNAYATGTYVCREPPHVNETRKFQGMARWSGTSFATPLVAGMIASRMSHTGENGRRAADALLAKAREQRIPGVGPVLKPAAHGGDTG